MRSLLRAEAPRYTAPPALRARLESLLAVPASVPAATRTPGRTPGWRTWLARPRWAVGSLAGALALLLVVWGGWSWLAQDPTTRLLATASTEHREYRQEMMARPAPDPQAVLRTLKEGVGYPLPPTFLGDAAVKLVGGKVTEVSGMRAAALVYRDEGDRYSTLFMLPESAVAIPAGGRTAIETFKPYHRSLSGRELFLWKQGGVACVLVSDMDAAGSASMFLRVRKAL
jgi:anti-sigma factor RsiW